jgi:hypothetical protein
VIRCLAWACFALAASAGLRAEGSPQALSATTALSSTAAVDAALVTGPKDSGFEYCFGATALSVFNASPLALTPFELGWRFANGLHVRTGVDVFYYEGLDDAKPPDGSLHHYSYEMRDIRTSLLYSVPLPFRLRPMAGLTMELLGGTRKLSGLGVVNPSTMDAWGYLGTGAILGAECRLSEHWYVDLLARYTFSFATVGPMTGLGLNMVCLF